ncbi:MAG: hypothetical protein ACHQ1D_12140 [Nitrososphaerales archaeon]
MAAAIDEYIKADFIVSKFDLSKENKRRNGSEASIAPKKMMHANKENNRSPDPTNFLNSCVSSWAYATATFWANTILNAPPIIPNHAIRLPVASHTP